MTALSAGLVPLGVRIRNARYDGLLTGFVHGGPQFVKTDPGGYRSGSFVVDQRLGFRSDMIQPYSRVYFYNKRNGDVVFEGDVSHPGRSITNDGALLEVNVEGGVERLNDWSGPRIYVDRDLDAWVKAADLSIVSTTVDAGVDRGGSGLDALNLAFPMDTHVDSGHRVDVRYSRIADAGQTIGRIDYTWDAGTTNALWLVSMITTPPSTAARSQSLSTSGGSSSPITVGTDFAAGSNYAIGELKWTGGASSTGTTGADICWVSLRGLVIVAAMVLKDGTDRPAAGYSNAVTAVKVWEDMLGSMLATSFDGVNAQLDAGASNSIWQLAWPDGVTPQQVADELMRFEPSCTYIVGASNPTNDKYSIKWMARTDVPRYEFSVYADEYSGGVQSVEQYNEVATRWQTPTGQVRFTNATQSIPEMSAAGRTRRAFQDLGVVSGDTLNAGQANSTVLLDHRFPQNGGTVKVQRQVVDLFTGRRVEPFEIEPGYIARIVGIGPSNDALNNSPRNGSTLCRIVSTDYSADDHSVSIALDSLPWSIFKAIAASRVKKVPRNGPGRYPSR